MKCILGIDVGTSNVKAVLFGELGEEISISSRETKIINQSANGVEQDMNYVWEQVKQCIHDTIECEQAGTVEIEGIGITGQGEGCWLIDKDGSPVQNAILWCDGRAIDEVQDISDNNGDLKQKYHSITGTPPLPGNQMILIRWMKHNRPDILKRASKVLFCKDWIRFKMTGVVAAELTDSMTSLVDTETEEISKELMKLLGIEEYYDYIPRPVRSGEIVGTILDDFADEVGLRRGIPVIAGALDTSATCVGVGAIHEKDVCVILGTTCACEVVTSKRECNFGEEGTRYEKHPIGDLYVKLHAALNGTPNLDWMVSNIANTRDFKELDKIVSDEPVGCGGVVYHPYISVAGERSPFYHPYARASFFGISQVTTKNQLIRAVYEGVSLSIRDCLQFIDRSGTVFLAGGGAKSDVWAQMISDVLGMKVVISEGKELGAKGVALIAGVKQGIYKNYEEAIKKTCSFKKTFYPNEVNVKKYEMIYELYKAVRIHNQEMWDYRHQMNKKIKAMEEKA